MAARPSHTLFGPALHRIPLRVCHAGHTEGSRDGRAQVLRMLRPGAGGADHLRLHLSCGECAGLVPLRTPAQCDVRIDIRHGRGCGRREEVL